MYICVLAHVYAGACAFVYAKACGWCWLSSLIILHLIYWIRVSYWTWSFACLFWLGWLASSFWILCSLSLPPECCEYRQDYSAHLVFMWVLVDLNSDPPACTPRPFPTEPFLQTSVLLLEHSVWSLLRYNSIVVNLHSGSIELNGF